MLTLIVYELEKYQSGYYEVISYKMYVRINRIKSDTSK